MEFAKGAKAEALNEALLDPLEAMKELNIAVTVRYINTSENPADSVSRGREPDWVVALGTHERGGGGRPLSVLVNPLRNQPQNLAEEIPGAQLDPE